MPPLSLKDAIARAEQVEQKLLKRLKAAELAAASPGVDPKAAKIAQTELGSLRKAVAAVQQEKLSMTQSAMQDSIQHLASANTGGEPLIEEPGAGLAQQPPQQASALAGQQQQGGVDEGDPQALLEAQNQQAQQVREKAAADPEFAGGLLARAWGNIEQSLGEGGGDTADPADDRPGVVEGLKGAAQKTGSAILGAGEAAVGAVKTAGEAVAAGFGFTPQVDPDPSRLPSSVPTPPAAAPVNKGGRFPLSKSTEPSKFASGGAFPAEDPDRPATDTGVRTKPGAGVTLDPDYLTNRAVAAAKDKRARSEGIIGEGAKRSTNPDIDALRELLGRKPDGAPTKPEGFTRGQRLAAGFLAVADPAMYQMLVHPELARREAVAARADVLKAQAAGKEQAGAIVLAQLETARLGRESDERIAAAEIAGDARKLLVASSASLLAVSNEVEDLQEELKVVIEQLEGPGADQGRRAYAGRLRSQMNSLTSFMAPYKERPDLLTPRVMRDIVVKRIRDVRQAMTKGVQAAAKAAQVGPSEFDDYIGTRDAFDASRAALDLLKTGSGFPFGLSQPGGGVEGAIISVLPFLTPGDTATLDAMLSAISGVLTSIAGGKNLTITELVLFGGRFPRASDNPTVLLKKLENAISFFGRRSQNMDRFRGGSDRYGFANSVSFDDPLNGGDFHDFSEGRAGHPDGNQAMRDVGAFPAVGNVPIRHPDAQFVVPEGFTDQGYVMEVE